MAPRVQSSHSADEEALVQRASAGEERACSALYHRHAGYVAGVVHRMLGSDADVDDIVQETFVEGLRQLTSLREADKLRSFLLTIAVRRIHARLSFRYRMKGLAARLFGVTPTVSRPEEMDRVRAIYEILARFPARHRIVWVLHRVEGYTLPEVVDQSDASLATVKRWIGAIDQALEASDASC